MSKGAFHIPSLDGLRAVSFLIVFVAHAGLTGVPGGFGVTVFFGLSGFLITTLMRMEFEKTHTVSLKAFYLRRVLRILPPFYLVLTLATVLAALGVIQGALQTNAVLAQYLHYANYWIVRHGYEGQALGTGVYWSLAVEEHFYFLFPWLYLGLRKLGIAGRSQALVLFALCGVILAWRVWLVYGQHVPMDRTYLASDTRFDSILFGAALAVWGNPVLDGEPKGGLKLWKYVLLPVSLVVLLFCFVYRDDSFRETFRYSLQGLALLPVFVVAVRAPEWAPFRVLNWKPVAFVGVLSYSLYLTHHVVLYGISHHFPGWPGLVRGLVSLALSLGLAYTIYRLVEQPAATLRKRLTK